MDTSRAVRIVLLLVVAGVGLVVMFWLMSPEPVGDPVPAVRVGARDLRPRAVTPAEAVPPATAARVDDGEEPSDLPIAISPTAWRDRMVMAGGNWRERSTVALRIFSAQHNLSESTSAELMAIHEEMFETMAAAQLGPDALVTEHVRAGDAVEAARVAADEAFVDVLGDEMALELKRALAAP